MSSQTRVTVTDLARLRERGEKIAMLTCYDASFAALADAAGVELLLVGDSLGVVIQGHETTLAVTMADVAYHVRAVAKGTRGALIIADLPFGSYQANAQEAFRNAAQLMAAGAQMVKLEGGRHMHDTVRFLVDRGIPVCGHIGLTPQAVHQLGGYRVQGRGEAAAKELRSEADLLQQAGATLIVLELVPASLAAAITSELRIPTIGIGAGPGCSGQVLVLYDMLDIYPGHKPRFVRNFMVGSASIQDALKKYVAEVKAGGFPTLEHAPRES
jgi:3-methyl-2-oxobutanoate hydroxymethyltransferase